MKILVTGAAGYIGNRLLRALNLSGHEVIGIDNLFYNQEVPLYSKCKFSIQDVRELPFVKEADVIVNLAALVGAPVCSKHPKLAYEVNQDTVRRLVEAISPNQRLLQMTSTSGYGQTDGKDFCDENSPLNPISLYGQSKVDAEKYAMEHANSVSLRLATVFGFSNRMRVDLMVNNFTAQLFFIQHLKIFEPTFKRNFVHIDDVVRCIVFMIDNPQYTGIFNVGLPDANITKIQLAHEIASHIPFRTKIEIGEGKDVDQRNCVISSDKLLGTGFEFKHTLKEGVCSLTGFFSRFNNYGEVSSMGNA